jgi:membrane protein implicated in regulation of membrane protease activity
VATPAPRTNHLARYLFAQVPGWVIVAIGAVVASAYGAEPRLAWTIAAAWIVKDLIAYPFVRRAYERSRSATEALVGSVGVVRNPLAPSGWVTIRGEVWRAELDTGAASEPVPAGRKVRVESVEGRTLRVVPVRDTQVNQT